MSTIPAHDELRPVTALPEERAEVAALSRALAAVGPGSSTACAMVGPHGERLPIPSALLQIIERAAVVLARGDALTVVPIGQILTTQEAADILNVSRQYLVRLLDAGTIPCSRTGTHRRLRIEDVLSYKEQRDRERRAALDELTALSEEFGGYAELK